MLLKRQPRTGSVLIESALIYPVLFLLVMGVILMGIGVFRFQQVSHISREASRWASVKGEKYAQENNTTPATPQDVYNNAILPHAAGMQPAAISYTVAWLPDASGNPDKRQTRTVVVYDPVTGLYETKSISNTVSVTVTYTWETGMFGTIPVSSTSVNTISY